MSIAGKGPAHYEGIPNGQALPWSMRQRRRSSFSPSRNRNRSLLMHQSRILFLAPLLLVSSCALFSKHNSDTPDQPVLANHVDNSMLQYISAGDRTEIDATRQAADAARDAYAASKADAFKAAERRKVATQELDIAQAEQKRAESVQTIAESGTQEDLVAAKQSVADAKMLVKSVESRVSLRDRQVEYARAIEDLRQKQNELAQATVELSQARAVKRVDRPDTRSIKVEPFEHQVRQYHEEAQIASVHAEAVQGELNVARQAYDETVKAVPAHYTKDWPSEAEANGQAQTKSSGK